MPIILNDQPFWHLLFKCDDFRGCIAEVTVALGDDKKGIQARDAVVNKRNWRIMFSQHYGELCFCPDHKNHVVNRAMAVGNGCHNCRYFTPVDDPHYESEPEDSCRKGIRNTHRGPCESCHWELKS